MSRRRFLGRPCGFPLCPFRKRLDVGGRPYPTTLSASSAPSLTDGSPRPLQLVGIQDVPLYVVDLVLAQLATSWPAYAGLCRPVGELHANPVLAFTTPTRIRYTNA